MRKCAGPFLLGVIFMLSGCLDPYVNVTPIKCTLAGVTVLDGYATTRNGIIRQEYYDTETGEIQMLTLVPGTKCTRGERLRQSEWDVVLLGVR